jgi:hypothetical protein
MIVCCNGEKRGIKKRRETHLYPCRFECGNATGDKVEQRVRVKVQTQLVLGKYTSTDGT